MVEPLSEIDSAFIQNYIFFVKQDMKLKVAKVMKEFSLIFLHDVKIDSMIDLTLTTWYVVTAPKVNFLLSVTIFYLNLILDSLKIYR